MTDSMRSRPLPIPPPPHELAGVGAVWLRVPLQPTESPGTGGGRFALAHKQVFLGGLVTVLGEQ